MKVILAEKPSVARDIARCLKATQKHDGYIEGKGFVVTWAFGHMVELQEPAEYEPSWKSWSLHTLPMIPPAFRLRPRGDDAALRQLKVIKQLFTDAEELICATDAGREGELIFRYIQQWTQTEAKPFRRLWISSLTDDAIKKGFKALKPGRDLDPLYQAARCRSESDWIVGLNATRFFTVKYGRQGELWSVGRVQTPVLAMIVARDKLIEAFATQDYWQLGTVYRETVFKHERARIDDQEEAIRLLAKVKDHDLQIVDIQEKKKRFNPPLLYDLTELQRDMNKRWGMTAKRTLKAAQDLYERKHLTYPRTDSRYLTTDIQPEVPGVLKRLEDLRPAAITGLDLANLPFSKRIVNDAKVADHHAIIPTNNPPRGLDGDHGKVYEAVMMRFIAAFYPPCVKSITSVRALSNAEPFKTSGTVIVEPGWQQLFPKMMKKPGKKPKKKADDNAAEDEEDLDQVLPVFTKGELGPHEPIVKTMTTKPPKAFTEASLLQMMETAGKQVDDENLKEALKEKGIGTPATRAGIIEVLLHRGYITRRKKHLISTDTGRDLIAIIQDESLKSPELTGEWEWHLKQIEQTRFAPDEFMAQVADHIRRILSQTGTVKRGPKHLAPCPCCDGQIIEGKRGYGCSRWKAGCGFVIWKDQFGARINHQLLQELVVNKKTATALQLSVDGKRFHARLQLDKDHQVTWDRLGARGKVEGRAILGSCPLCDSDVVESEKAYGCCSWREGCGFVVWKTMSHRKIPKAMVKVLLKEGVTPFIQKFKNKAGKRFDARLKLCDGKVQFDFTPTEKPTKQASIPEAEPPAGPADNHTP